MKSEVPPLSNGRENFEIAVVGDAGGEPRQHEGVPVGKRHQRDPLLVDDLSGRAAARVEQRRLGRDRDGLLEVSDLQRERQLETVADSDLDALPGQFLETGKLGRDLVRARREVWD